MKNSEISAEKFNKILLPPSIEPSELLASLGSYFPHLEKILKNKNSISFARGEKMNEIGEVINSDIPQTSSSLSELENFITTELIPRFSYENVNFFGYIPKSPAAPSIIAESLTPFFNQFLGNADSSPAATAIESQAIIWIGEMLGYTGNYFGNFSIGGSSANMEGIYTGLISKIPWNYKKDGLFNHKRPIIYTSDQTHMCVKKAILMLGLGLDSLRIIESDEKFMLSLDRLRKQIDVDIQDPNLLPLMIIATAGTTNTGAIDNFESLSEIAKSNNLWLHIDGAYGGFARIADHSVSEKLKCLNLADSIAIDTHKWLYTTLEGGCLIVKNDQNLKNAFEVSAEYLKDIEFDESHTLIRNFSSYGFPLSRKWRGLMVWMNIKFYGVEGLSKLITRNILAAEYFAHKISEHGNMELTANPNLGVVCFRWHGDDDLNTRISSLLNEKGKFFIGRTTIKAQMTLRVCVLNLETTIEKMDELLIEIENITNSLI